MSPSKKNQNSSSQSKVVKRPTAAVIQTKDSIKTVEIKSSSSSVQVRKPGHDEVKAVAAHMAIRYHQNFVTQSHFTDTKNSRNVAKNAISGKMYHDATAKLRSEIKKSERECEGIPAIWDLFDQVMDNAEEMLQTCEVVDDQLSNECPTLVDDLNKAMKAIGEIQDQIKTRVEGSINRQKSFDRENLIIQRRLDKVNANVDFLSNSRDDVCLQIGEKNKILNELSNTLGILKNSNKKLIDDIDAKKRKKADKEVALSNVASVSQWVTEKTETLDHLKHEKAELKKVQKKLKSSKDMAQKNWRSYCEEVSELTKEIAEQEQFIRRINAANKNLRNVIENSEFKEKSAVRLAELKKLSDYVVEKQSEVEKKQQQLNELKRIKDEISKKKQYRDALKYKLKSLEDKIFKQQNELLVIQEYLYAMKSAGNQEDDAPLPKRPKRSITSNELIKLMKNQSKDLPDTGDLGADSDSYTNN